MMLLISTFSYSQNTYHGGKHMYIYINSIKQQGSATSLTVEYRVFSHRVPAHNRTKLHRSSLSRI